MPPDGVSPDGVVTPVKPKVRGRSFFPGGCGLCNGVSQGLHPRSVMLVGQDFADVAYWREVPEAGEVSQGTWSALESMLSAASVDPRHCSFTNALLGVRVHGPIQNPSPGLAFRTYVEASLCCLLKQTRIVRPSVVVSLRKIPSILLGRRFGLTNSLIAPHPDENRNPDWREIDAALTPFHRTGRD